MSRTTREPEAAVLVPALNEEKNLPVLVERLRSAMTSANIPFELVVVLDGGSDGSMEWLKTRARTFPELVVVRLARTVGQHTALAVGLRFVTAPFVVTLDADLQNPPESVPAVVRRLAVGAEAVGTVRAGRQDSLSRKAASFLFRQAFAALRPRHPLSDPGCMLRGYRKEVVDRFLSTTGPTYYLPLQLGDLAESYAEFQTPHEARNSGESRYRGTGLLRLFLRVVRGRVATWSLPAVAPKVAEVLRGSAREDQAT
jgi:undecaprenyl-phosphate 4-deoxy-4-formamido-L-arabinose transferase